MDRKMDDKCFDAFKKFIHDLTGITIGPDRISMVEGRIVRRVKALELDSYEAYFRFVRTNEQEQRNFIDSVTTNETYFFRTPRIWDYIENTFLPQWFDRNQGQKMIAWSAAASSGEEAHSLGVMCEAFKTRNPGFRYQILGTDISPKMVGLCKAGNYSGRSIRAFRERRPEWFAKFMKSADGEKYQAIGSIRNQLRFSVHNLFETLTKATSFDLVLVRNVLIYFTPEDQEVALSHISPKLKDDSILIIGESESLAHINVPFSKRQPYIYQLEQTTPIHSGS